MFKITTKCSCGKCKQTYFRIEFFKFFIWYFTDYGPWWFRIGTPWVVFSYSPCQGWKKYKRSDFKF